MATSGSKSITVTNWDTLKFSWSCGNPDIANNQTVVNWKLELIATSAGYIQSSAPKKWSVTVNGTTYSGTNYIGIANNATKQLASGSTTIKHTSNGTKTFSYSFSQAFDITFGGTKIGTKSGSGSGTLPTIPRQSTLSASNGTLNTEQSLTIARNVSTYTHTITYKCGSATGTIVTKTTAVSVPFTPPLSLASQAPNGTSVSITFTLTTYNGDTSIGTSSKTITCAIPTSVVPSVSIAVSDPTGYFTTYGKYVQNKSKIKIVLTETGSYGSTVKSRSIKVDGATYSSSTVTTGVIRGTGTLTITATVTDSRGRSKSNSTTINVLPYKGISISAFDIKRCNQDGTSNPSGAYLCVAFAAKVDSLDSKNTAEYSIQYKKTTEDTFTSTAIDSLSGKYSVTLYEFIFAAETTSTYDIILTVTDAFGSLDRHGNGRTVGKLISILQKGLGIALGKYAEFENMLDVAFRIFPQGGFKNPILKDGTDLDSVIIPNTYTSKNASSAGYVHCPITSGTFTLEVASCGDTDQIVQRLTMCKKDIGITYERFYYTSAWGEWVQIYRPDGNILWTGSYHMVDTHTANLSEAVSDQKNGIVLVFSRYSASTVRDYGWNTFFIHKEHVKNHSGQGSTFLMTNDSAVSVIGAKYLYISNRSITGHANNNVSNTGNPSGIKYENGGFVLRYVIGV